MNVVTHPELWLCILPFLAAVGLAFLLGGTLSRRAALALPTLGAAVSAVFWGRAVQRLLDEGRFSDAEVNAYTGAVLRAPSLVEAVPLALRLDPGSALMVLSYGLGAASLVLFGHSTWGGGKRAAGGPISAGQILGAALAMGLTVTLPLLADLSSMVFVLALASFAGFFVWLSTLRKRVAAERALVLFLWHRISDIALFVAVGIITLAVPFQTLPAFLDGSSFALITSGPFVDYPLGALRQAVAWLCVGGVALRLAPFPLTRALMGMGHTQNVTMGIAHVFSFLAPVLMTLPVWLPLIAADPSAQLVFQYILGAGVVVAALGALNAQIVPEIDLFAFYTTAGIAVLAASVGHWAALWVLSATLFLLTAPLLLSFANAIEAMQGANNVFALGGLWRALRLSDSMRTLATLALLVGPGGVAFVWTVYFHRFSPHAAPGVTVMILVALVFLSVALFRGLHLVFSGDALPKGAPAVLVKMPKRRAWPLWLLSLGALLAVIGVMPRFIGRLVVPDAFPPVMMFVEPAVAPLRALQFRWAQVGNDAIPQPMSALVAVLLAVVAGYLMSVLLYRKGVTPRYERVMKNRAVALLLSPLGADTWWHATFRRLLADPLLKLAGYVVNVVLPVGLYGPLARLPGFAIAVTQTALRMLHSGDVQRSLAWIVVGIGLMLLLWGTR